MIMFYFSGTGNSRHIAELFCREMNAACHSIEEDVDFVSLIGENEVIAFCYPIYASRVPRIMRQFAARHIAGLKDKKLIIFCTQMLFSGDGARAFAALFPKGHIKVIYAEHFFMPNNINNVFILPMSSDRGIEKYIAGAERKMRSVCAGIKRGRIKKRGFNVISRGLGLTQGVLLPMLEKKANNSVRVTSDCVNCRVCVTVCPTKNLVYENEKITHNHDCTMCYRCTNKCPEKAINICFNGKIKKQYYLNRKAADAHE